MPIFEAVNPDEIFVSSRIDVHPDHRALANAARQLIYCRGPNLPNLYEYPIWFWHPLAWRHGRLRSLQVRTVQAQEFLARKRAAIAAYSSQMTKLTGEATWMTFSDGFLRQFLQPEKIFLARFHRDNGRAKNASENIAVARSRLLRRTNKSETLSVEIER
jgi:LmbE family N-acetylglucosaminyl deacetylase